ncbi:pyridoxamine 5'-phosphate oxidase family protein [Microlunatus speluncae]|uniref:pyridoxamine 5'-phosphate oxidase family protein n=1 Tax=Microlunatus speluncae TaxID=2594267 RepID=UPI001FE4E86E|nr:pyridoxamine 5'-phosphate oxidase family protein [Microlunatus speluncae]
MAMAELDQHPELDVLPEWPTETVAVLVTQDTESGAPHAIPVSWPVRAGDRRILISLRHNRGSLVRLRARPEVALVIVGGGDVALCARGTARVVREELQPDGEYAGVEITVTVIDDHRQGAFAVADGIRRTVLDPSELAALEHRVTELRELADP